MIEFGIVPYPSIYLSAKHCFQESLGSTLRNAVLIPPAAKTVCASVLTSLPRTETSSPRSLRSIEALNPAPLHPIT